MEYRVIITANGKYKKTLHRSLTRETAFRNYHQFIVDNKAVKYPKRFINTKKILPVKYQICVVKDTEPTDTFRILRNDMGKVYTEKPIGSWTILTSEDYNLEETFWIFGYDAKLKRPTIEVIIKKLVVGAFRKNMTKQVLVVHNKLVIYNEDQFDMVICKCKEDAQRLHHTLAKIAKKQKIRSVIFMGTATKATVSRMYDLIAKHTKWKLSKIRRLTTRP